MHRDFNRLADGSFDLLVVGGGIYGAWTACDAALRGLRVAIVEKGDWASGTSSCSSKLIHGGLRYLEQFHFGLVRKALAERALLTRLAPHLVRPGRFVIPLYRGGRVGPLRMGAGLALYRILSGGDDPGSGSLSAGPRRSLEKFPFLEGRGLLRTLSYGDCITDDARLTFEVVDHAVRAGAVAVSYVSAVRPLLRKGCAAGLVVEDRLDGGEAEVPAKAVVNTAGPWVTGMAECRSLAGEVRLTKGVHALFPALPTKDAFLFLTRRDRRILFFIPWYGRTLVGTTDTDYRGDPDAVAAEDVDMDYLMEEAGHALGGGTWERGAMVGSFAGLRALVDEPGKGPSEVRREWRLAEPLPGMLVSLGGKLTSARADAAVIVDRVTRSLGHSTAAPAPTEMMPFPRSPGGGGAGWEAVVAAEGEKHGLDPETAFRCTRHGTAAGRLFDIVRREPALSARLHPEAPFCEAEVLFCAGEEGAVRLEDILRRRIPLMLLCRPDRTLVDRAADLAAGPLGWPEERRRAEAAAAMSFWEASAP